MRLYLKPLGMVIVFALACRADVRVLVAQQWIETRLALVAAFGSAAEYEH
jgi:hypothetical protein